jgi:hypothetical protein
MSEQWGAGDRAQWSNHGLVTIGKKRYPLIYGEHPHSRNDNRHYVEMDGAEPTGFDGHRILIGVNLQSENYLKESELSGNEVRKGGNGQILADGEVVYEFFFRDIGYALRKAQQVIDQLSDGTCDWLIKERRDALIGRKLFYREHPAVVERLIVGQGCLILRTEDGKPFPPPVWRDANEDEDGEPTVKVEVTDPHIWWWRS